jgi:ABC-2 type transport system permease protein
MNRRRVREIVRKEFRQAFREPRMRFVMIMPPLIQLMIFGFAVNMDVEHAAIAWMDRDGTPESRELEARFQGSAYFDIKQRPATDEEAQDLLDHGRVMAVIRVLPGFGGDVKAGHKSNVQILIDGANSNTASIVSNYASQVVQGYSRGVQLERQRQRMAGRTTDGAMNTATPEVTAQSRVWFNPELKSRNYFVPGVVANIISLVTLMLTSMAIVREKEIGTMEQLMVTPIRPLELIIGKTVPFALVGMANMIMITTAALLVFHVPLRGSVFMLTGCTALFLMTTLGMGLFLSTVSQTQQQAMMASFFYFQPAFMLSGFAFPIRNMPEVIQWVSYLNPTRYFMEIVRGVFLKGVGPEVLWPQMVALAVLGSGILLTSALRFHKRVE